MLNVDLNVENMVLDRQTDRQFKQKQCNNIKIRTDDIKKLKIKDFNVNKGMIVFCNSSAFMYSL